ncbi:hypothetical protein TNCV_3016611 [Trichonephila clavipes]|nr:hypothetical protein TNCV_3016611 [Trichonephila clavipes]
MWLPPQDNSSVPHPSVPCRYDLYSLRLTSNGVWSVRTNAPGGMRKDDICAFTRGRIIGRSWRKAAVDKCGCRVRNCSQHRFREGFDFGYNFKLQEQLSGGSVVVVHEEPHPQMTGTLSYRPEETGGRQWEKSLDTRHRRLDDRCRVLPWPEDCTVVVCLHDAL